MEIFCLIHGRISGVDAKGSEPLFAVIKIGLSIRFGHRGVRKLYHLVLACKGVLEEYIICWIDSTTSRDS